MTTEAVGKDISRRDFLNYVIGTSFAVSGAFALATLVKVVTPPDRNIEGKTKPVWQVVAKTTKLEEGAPVLVEAGDEFAFVTKVSNKIMALSAACPHVRCKLHLNEKTREYDCPCHASSFTIEGKLLGGPAPRDMFPMELKLEGDNVLIKAELDSLPSDVEWPTIA